MSPAMTAEKNAIRETSELAGAWLASMTKKGSSEPLCHVRSNGLISYATRKVQKLFGRGDLPDARFLDLVDDADRQDAAHMISLVQGSQQEGRMFFRSAHPERGRLHLEASLVPAGDAGGVILRIDDVTQQHKDRKRLEGMVRWFRALTRNSADVIVVVGSDLDHRFVSGGCEAILGYTPDELTREVFRDAIHPTDRMRVLLEFESVRQDDGATGTVRYRFQHKDGRWLHVETHAVNRSSDPDVRGVLFYTRDVTDRSVRDPVTGLPNRPLLLDRLQQVLSVEQERVFGVVVLQLDRHGFVRGTLGADAADTLMKVFAKRLTTVAAPNWTVARTGENEFTVLVMGLPDLNSIRPIAEGIGKLAKERFKVGVDEVVSTVTMGIALSARRYPGAVEMLRDAQTALVKAQEKGGPMRQVANSEVISRHADKVRVETELHRALAREEFRVAFQPVVSMVDAKLVGFEALIRWKHPTRGVLGPTEFLPVAEESGLIAAIGDWVLRRSCARLARWRAVLPEARDLTIAVNLSVKQLNEQDFAGRVLRTLESYDLPLSAIKLELTETALLERPEAAAAVLQKLRDAGMTIVLDDFGTGYCSLAYLTRFPIDALKIDRQFVSGSDGILTSERGKPLVRAILDLAASLRLQVVGEGIETQEQADALHSMGCQHGQGWLFGKPMGPRGARDLIVSS